MIDKLTRKKIRLFDVADSLGPRIGEKGQSKTLSDLHRKIHLSLLAQAKIRTHNPQITYESNALPTELSQLLKLDNTQIKVWAAL